MLVVTAGDDESEPQEAAAPLELAVADARADASSKVVSLVSLNGQTGGEIVIDADGHGFVLGEDLPALPDNRTWQLWGVVDGAAISLGILGHDPTIELFTVEAPVSQLIVTNEVAGGVISDGNPEGSYGGFVG